MASTSIGVVCHFPPPAGGMSVQAEILVAGLRSEGIDAMPIETNLGRSGIMRQLDDVRFLRSFLRTPVFLYRLLRVLPRVNILHIHTCAGLYFFLFAAPAMLAGRAAGKRVIFHCHSGNAPNFFRKSGAIGRTLLRCAHRILVPSEYLFHVFRDLGFESTVISNVCDVARFSDSPRPLAPEFVVARNLEPVYGVDTILRAFPMILERYPAAILTILGTGTERDRLHGLVHELGITERVTFLGAVENSSIPALFANAAVFLNASLTDNQPVSILEAFAARLPVVTSNAGGIPFLVKQDETGLLFPPGDYTALASAVFRLFDTPGLAEQCVRNGRAFVEQYAWPAIFRKLANVYGLDVAAVETTPAICAEDPEFA
jgi:glycosyltransferase involved in cell wall biosynthesis